MNIWHIEYLQSRYVTIASSRSEAIANAVEHIMYISGRDFPIPIIHAERQEYLNEKLVQIGQ